MKSIETWGFIITQGAKKIKNRDINNVKILYESKYVKKPNKKGRQKRFILRIENIHVNKKLREHKIHEIQAKCKLKIAKQTAKPSSESILLRGEITIHPLSRSTNIEHTNKISESGNNQKARRLRRGKAIPRSLVFNET